VRWSLGPQTVNTQQLLELAHHSIIKTKWSMLRSKYTRHRHLLREASVENATSVTRLGTNVIKNKTKNTQTVKDYEDRCLLAEIYGHFGETRYLHLLGRSVLRACVNI
jgi:hypothetical protein